MSLLFFFSFVTEQTSSAITELENDTQLINAYGLSRLFRHTHYQDLRIAVLDNGFVGYKQNAGFLPSNTERITIYPEDFARRNNFPLGTRRSVGDHGLRIAQIIWSMMNKQEQGVKFYLLQTNGFSQFQKGVQWAIEQEVDIICYAQVWENAGNFDGRGFLNKMVKRATDKGIIWVNAAGNFGGKVYNGKLTSSGGYVYFSNHRDRLEIDSHRDDNAVVIKLVWNEFGETRETPPTKDLDLYLIDEQGNTIASGEKIQVRKPGETREENGSYPFEYVSANLERGRYYLKIKHVGGRLYHSDRIRVIVNAQNYHEIDFIDATVGQEIMIPADSPHVLTAGISGVLGSVGPTMDGRLKPEFIVTNSYVAFTDGQQHDTTSSATGILSGVIALMKGVCPRLDHQGIISLLQEPRRSGIDQPRLNQVPRLQTLKDECLRRYGSLSPRPRSGTYPRPDPGSGTETDPGSGTEPGTGTSPGSGTGTEYPNPPPGLREMQLANQYYAQGDYGRAYSYFKTAANMGNRDGQFMLGKMYFEGIGVVKNLTKAKLWFTKAKDNGHRDAHRYLSQIP